MTKRTYQEQKWSGKFGRDYTFRNPQSPEEMDTLYIKKHGISRTELNKDFLKGLDLASKILEVGSNVGVQLMFLKKMKFQELYGIEMNKKAIEFSKSITKDLNILWGSALDIPFKDSFFDFVFTSGILIHIAPFDLKKVMEEIHRCTKKYIWGFEPYASKLVEIAYRGEKSLHWKGPYSKMYLDLFSDLKLVKERKIQYLDNDNIDAMFLLKKNEKKLQS